MIAIYRIRHTESGKFYVGSSVDTRVRFQTHRRQLRRGNHHCAHLQNAWNKYGEENFRFEIVEPVALPGDLFEVENRWLAEHHGKDYCYNIGRYADAPTRGTKFSAAHKAKISSALMGNQIAKGHKRSQEDIEKIRQRKMGNKNSLGKTHSEETRAQMSRSALGAKRRLGQTNSPEHNRRISEANKGRVVSEETRAKRHIPVIEITSGAEFRSVAEAGERFGINRPNMVRALKKDAPIKRGPNAGLHFRYLEKHALPPASK